MNSLDRTINACDVRGPSAQLHDVHSVEMGLILDFLSRSGLMKQNRRNFRSFTRGFQVLLEDAFLAEERPPVGQRNGVFLYEQKPLFILLTFV